MDLLVPLAVFAVARVVSGVMLAVTARLQPDLTDDPFWHVEGTRPANPSYLEVLSNWDGQWFKTIALHGYGAVADGRASDQSALAFSPVYPFLVRAVMAVTGLGFEAAASGVSLVASAAAVVLLFRWLLVTRGRGPRSPRSSSCPSSRRRRCSRPRTATDWRCSSSSSCSARSPRTAGGSRGPWPRPSR
ncbi:hypothetical protein G7075_10340 [Phycicoccus sp. HDW14]|uniref:hypothetical protein n=1 Tax=Phycicoccus sp. HDW14 TaxID=2714941 RepID=UPI001407F80D|nr:hypothetical protein [Phycicoccus sp. HDW14]QIM21430.1 hypothetical protein G7075_10340 [Phycicoccus sp. HDW14]